MKKDSKIFLAFYCIGMAIMLLNFGNFWVSMFGAYMVVATLCCYLVYAIGHSERLKRQSAIATKNYDIRDKALTQAQNLPLVNCVETENHGDKNE